MSARDLIDREGMRDDLIKMSERADSEFDRANMRPETRCTRLNELMTFEGKCLDFARELRLRKQGR